MSKQITWEQFRGVVCEHLGLTETEIKEATDIYRDIGLDSLGIVSLGMKLQSEFQITIPLYEIPIMQTVGDMYQKLLEYIQ